METMREFLLDDLTADTPDRLDGAATGILAALGMAGYKIVAS